MSGRRRWASVLAYGATFIAGALAWEVVRLATMNHADREDLVDQMIDARQRAHPIDLPARHLSLTPTPIDVLDDKAAAEFARCGGSQARPWSQEILAPVVDAEIILRDHRVGREERLRSEMAGTNSVFTLRRIQLCRSFGGCGPDLPPAIERPSPATLAREAENERESSWPTTWANAEPFVLSLACGMGLREKQGLPSYPNEAHFVAEYRAWRADHARRCAGGDRTACP